jgi:hypothetical protein
MAIAAWRASSTGRDLTPFGSCLDWPGACALPHHRARRERGHGAHPRRHGLPTALAARRRRQAPRPALGDHDGPVVARELWSRSSVGADSRVVTDDGDRRALPRRALRLPAALPDPRPNERPSSRRSPSPRRSAGDGPRAVGGSVLGTRRPPRRARSAGGGLVVASSPRGATAVVAGGEQRRRRRRPDGPDLRVAITYRNPDLHRLSVVRPGPGCVAVRTVGLPANCRCGGESARNATGTGARRSPSSAPNRQARTPSLY